jgi:(R)-amidase
VTGTVRVLLAQLAPVTHDPDANVATACALLDEHPGADVAVFPELFLQSYALRGIAPIDLDAPGSLDRLLDAAGRNATAVLVGAATRDGAGMANAALCIDEQGRLAARYRKVHLFGAEPRFFEAGDEFVVVHVAGVDAGVLLCYDVEFPEAARALAMAGAELLVTLSANMDPFAEDHALFVRVRALENTVPHVYVNCVGEEGRLRFCGGSSVADASGRLVAELPAYRPEVRVVEVPLGPPVRAVASPEYLTDRRPGVPVRAHGRRNVR